MADKKPNTATLPAEPDPYDMDVKRELSARADGKNRVEIIGGRLTLTCGGRKTKHGRNGYCRSRAGMGTDHVGYGRCKFCGGNNKGPRTLEGKAAIAGNSRKHGLYSTALDDEERELYETLLAEQKISLIHEINLVKTKIIGYLRRAVQEREATGKAQYRWGTNDTGLTADRYEVSTIEDKPLMRSLDTLARLVRTQAQITGDDEGDLIENVNKELRAASQGQVTLSWNTGAQRRKAGGR